MTAADLLVHLEAKFEAALAMGEAGLSQRLVELARFVREIAEAALVAGDEVTLREAGQLAAKLEPLAVLPEARDEQGVPVRCTALPVRTCPRCGQRFRGPSGPLDRVGTLLCEACARELLAGIRL